MTFICIAQMNPQGVAMDIYGYGFMFCYAQNRNWYGVWSKSPRGAFPEVLERQLSTSVAWVRPPIEKLLALRVKINLLFCIHSYIFHLLSSLLDSSTIVAGIGKYV